eukprot:2095215-Pyramimonas_sp.AAC.1
MGPLEPPSAGDLVAARKAHAVGAAASVDHMQHCAVSACRPFGCRQHFIYDDGNHEPPTTPCSGADDRAAAETSGRMPPDWA